MLSVKAHSFVQQAKLAITLAWVAGYTNVLTLLTCNTATSHMTGSASQLGRHLAERSWPAAGFMVWLLGAFFVGAMLSAACSELAHRRHWSSIYVLPMVVEALLLTGFAVAVFAHQHNQFESGWDLWWMTAIPSMAMGLQNATITRISSGVVRTSHVTGVLTDMGIEAVHALLARRTGASVGPGTGSAGADGMPTASRRLLLLTLIFVFFSVGAGLGTVAYDQSHEWAMVPAVLFLCWVVYQDIVKPIAEIRSVDLPASVEDVVLPRAIGVYRISRPGGKRSGPHRLPNLLAWCDRLPPETRAVVLDLEDPPAFDANAALELRAAICRLRAEGREVVVAGLHGEAYQQACHAGAGDVLNADTVCPDLDLAIARAMVLTYKKEST